MSEFNEPSDAAPANPLPYATPTPPTARQSKLFFLLGSIGAVVLIAGGVGTAIGGLMLAMRFRDEAAFAVGFGVGLTILGIGTLIALLLLRVRQQFQSP